jgi:hypothetical protein
MLRALEELDPHFEAPGGDGEDEIFFGLEVLIDGALGILRDRGEIVEIQPEVPMPAQEDASVLEEKLLTLRKLALTTSAGGHVCTSRPFLTPSQNLFFLEQPKTETRRAV